MDDPHLQRSWFQLINRTSFNALALCLMMDSRSANHGASGDEALLATT